MVTTIRRVGRPGDLGWVVQAHGEVYAAEFGWDTTFEALVARIVADYAAGHDPDREAGWIAEVDGRRAGCVFCVRADETGDDSADHTTEANADDDTHDDTGASTHGADDGTTADHATNDHTAEASTHDGIHASTRDTGDAITTDHDTAGGDTATDDTTRGDTAKLRILLVDPAARGHRLGGRLVDECLSFARGAGYRRMTLWTNDPLVAARRIYVERGFTLVSEEPHHSFGVDLVGQVYELAL